MNIDQAINLLAGVVQTAVMIAGPILSASLIAGVLMGILQTATQINETSLAYVVKITIVLGTLLVLGPTLTEKVVRYTRQSFEGIANVVK